MIFCRGLLMDVTTFPDPIFKSRTIFGNFKFSTFGMRKSWKTLCFRRSVYWLWILMDMTTFPYPNFKSRTIFGKNFSSQFQICGQNFKFPTFGVCKSWKTLFFRGSIFWLWLLMDITGSPYPFRKWSYFWKLDMGRQSYPSITAHIKLTF